MDLVIAIALWCGEPINQTKGYLNVKTGESRTTEQVNRCRMQLYNCAKTELSATGCFLKIKLEGK